MPAADQREYIIANGEEFTVGERGLSIEPYMGREDNPLNGWLHVLSIYAEPIDDQFPHLLFTDVELYKRGQMPKGLDGLRIRQSLETGDFSPPWVVAGRWLTKRPWIRPGSTVGMISVVYEPPSLTNSNSTKRDARKSLYIHGDLELTIDRVDSDLWRVEIELHHKAETDYIGRDGEAKSMENGIPAGTFKAAFNCPLEVVVYDD